MLAQADLNGRFRASVLNDVLQRLHAGEVDGRLGRLWIATHAGTLNHHRGSDAGLKRADESVLTVGVSAQTLRAVGRRPAT